MAAGSKQISLFRLRKLIVLLATTAAPSGGYARVRRTPDL
jgi:hypothetical protein